MRQVRPGLTGGWPGFRGPRPNGPGSPERMADTLPFLLVADDVFVIIPLPDRNAGGAVRGVDTFGGDGFELPDDGTNGTRHRATWGVHCRGDPAGLPYPGRPHNVVHDPDDPVDVIRHPTNSSGYNTTYGRTTAVWNHSARTISPHAFNRISPFTTSPNKHRCSCVTMVMKYPPTRV